MSTNKNILFYLIVFFLFTIFTSSIWGEGMFMDGIFYAVCAKNLSNGLGNFWTPHLTPSLLPFFHEHPPLAIGLQSIFFSVLGDSIYIEKIYSFLTFIITGLIIHYIWVQISDIQYKKYSWVPLLLWICIPINIWSCSNNMLENTMNIFVSLSVYFSIKYFKTNFYSYLFLTAFSIFLAFLSKGLTGTYPLAIFLCFFIAFKNNFKSTIYNTLKLILLFIIPFLMLYLIYPEAIYSLKKYFNKQVLNSIQEIKTVNNRFYIIIRLFSEISILLISVFAILLLARKNKMKPNQHHIKWSVFFLTVGFIGVIPIMISMKQSGFYIITTFPLFAIGLSILIIPYLANKLTIKKKTLIFINIFLLFVSSVFINYNLQGYSRDEELLKDIKLIINTIKDENTIYINSKQSRSIYSLRAYFFRYGNIDLNHNSKGKYFLKYNDDERIPNEKYKRVNLDTKTISLYKD